MTGRDSRAWAARTIGALILTLCVSARIDGEWRETRAELPTHPVPVTFVANAGQVDPEARFFAQGDGYGLYFGRTQAVFVFAAPGRSDGQAEPLPTSAALSGTGKPDARR